MSAYSDARRPYRSEGLPELGRYTGASSGRGAASASSRVDFEGLRKELAETKTLLALYAKRDEQSNRPPPANGFGSPARSNRPSSFDSPRRLQASTPQDPYVMQGHTGTTIEGQAAVSKYPTLVATGPTNDGATIYQPEPVEGLSPRRPLTASPARTTKSPAERLAMLRRRLDERDRSTRPASALNPSLDATFQRGRQLDNTGNWSDSNANAATPTKQRTGGALSHQDPRSPGQPQRVAAMDYTAANLRRQLDVKENTIRRLREEHERLKTSAGLDPSSALDGTVVLQLPDGVSKQDLQNFDSLVRVLAHNKLYNPDIQIPDVPDDAELKSYLTSTYVGQGVVRGAENTISAKSNWRTALRAISSYASTQRRAYALDRLSAPDVQSVMEDIDSLEFNVFALADITNNKPLVLTGYKIFQQHQLLQKFRLSGEKLHAFIDKVEAGYNESNAYHNSIHAADVMQATHWYLTEGGIARHLTNRDKLAALLAAMVHDIDHPGVNNNFLIATRDEKAILYNDMSVLEHHHAATCFKLLNDDRLNILENLSTDEYKEVRQTVIEMVLGTDLAQHFTSLKKFEALVKVGNIDYQDLSTRRLILKISLHCADISNPTRNAKLATRWSAAVQEEFFEQGDKERGLSLPISPFCDRFKPSVGKCQRGFIDFIVAPLFKVYAQLIENGELLLDNLERNREHWVLVEAKDAEDQARQVEAATQDDGVNPAPTAPGLAPAPAPPTQAPQTVQDGGGEDAPRENED